MTKKKCTVCARVIVSNQAEVIYIISIHWHRLENRSNWIVYIKQMELLPMQHSDAFVCTQKNGTQPFHFSSLEKRSRWNQRRYLFFASFAIAEPKMRIFILLILCLSTFLCNSSPIGKNWCRFVYANCLHWKQNNWLMTSFPFYFAEHRWESRFSF